VQNDKGQTPLHNAVMRKRVDAVKVLLQHGADPTIQDNEGKTPIDHAREAGYTDIIKILTEKTTTGRTRKKKNRKSIPA
jgi:ankyrin repeat protein